MATALGECPEVSRVDLLTRRLIDEQLSPDYSLPIEPLSDKVGIVRIDFADAVYLPKEALWDHLDSFADNALNCLQQQELTPDIIHSHYADAGYVATRPRVFGVKRRPDVRPITPGDSGHVAPRVCRIAARGSEARKEEQVASNVPETELCPA